MFVQSETPVKPACASECRDPNGEWCCEACQGQTCSGVGGAAPRGGAAARGGESSEDAEVESSAANSQKGKLGFWGLILSCCALLFVTMIDF